MAFYCNGLTGVCKCDILCADCKYYDNSGGKTIMTNADRIRAMGNEELALELMTWRLEATAKYHGVESNYPNTQKGILAWLEQPCEVTEECVEQEDKP